MISDKLQRSLEQLRGELDRLKHGDADARRHIEQLLAEIETHAPGEPAQHHGLRERIGETIRRFEVKHPTLTAALGEIAAALG